MSDKGSVAPKERINVTYVPATGDQVAEKELPLNLLVTGDFTGRNDDTALEERKTVSIDKNNFNDVMAKAEINLSFSVPNKLEEQSEDDIPVNLNIQAMQDFSPDNIAKQVPELAKLLALRESLVALKGPLGNVPEFRKKLQELITDENSRDQLLSELNFAIGDDKQ